MSKSKKHAYKVSGNPQKRAQQAKQKVSITNSYIIKNGIINDIKIIAIRHQKNCVKSEFVAGEVKFNGTIKMTAKKHLLHSVATKKWGHNAPIDYIAAYLSVSQSYIMMEQLQKPYGYVINFYEKGADLDAPHTYSCRHIIGVRTKAEFYDYLNSLKADLTNSNDYSIKDYQAA